MAKAEKVLLMSLLIVTFNYLMAIALPLTLSSQYFTYYETKVLTYDLTLKDSQFKSVTLHEGIGSFKGSAKVEGNKVFLGVFSQALAGWCLTSQIASFKWIIPLNGLLDKVDISLKIEPKPLMARSWGEFSHVGYAKLVATLTVGNKLLTLNRVNTSMTYTFHFEKPLTDKVEVTLALIAQAYAFSSSRKNPASSAYLAGYVIKGGREAHILWLPDKDHYIEVKYLKLNCHVRIKHKVPLINIILPTKTLLIAKGNALELEGYVNGSSKSLVELSAIVPKGFVCELPKTLIRPPSHFKLRLSVNEQATYGLHEVIIEAYDKISGQKTQFPLKVMVPNVEIKAFPSILNIKKYVNESKVVSVEITIYEVNGLKIPVKVLIDHKYGKLLNVYPREITGVTPLQFNLGIILKEQVPTSMYELHIKALQYGGNAPLCCTKITLNVESIGFLQVKVLPSFVKLDNGTGQATIRVFSIGPFKGKVKLSALAPDEIEASIDTNLKTPPFSAKLTLRVKKPLAEEHLFEIKIVATSNGMKGEAIVHALYVPPKYKSVVKEHKAYFDPNSIYLEADQRTPIRFTTNFYSTLPGTVNFAIIDRNNILARYSMECNGSVITHPSDSISLTLSLEVNSSKACGTYELSLLGKVANLSAKAKIVLKVCPRQFEDHNQSNKTFISITFKDLLGTLLRPRAEISNLIKPLSDTLFTISAPDIDSYIFRFWSVKGNAKLLSPWSKETIVEVRGPTTITAYYESSRSLFNLSNLSRESDINTALISDFDIKVVSVSNGEVIDRLLPGEEFQVRGIISLTSNVNEFKLLIRWFSKSHLVEEDEAKFRNYVVYDSHISFVTNVIKALDADYCLLVAKTDLGEAKILKLLVDRVKPKIMFIQVNENLSATIIVQAVWVSDEKPLLNRRGLTVYIPKIDKSFTIDDKGVAIATVALSSLRKASGNALTKHFILELRTEDLLPSSALMSTEVIYRKAALSIILQNESCCILQPLDWYSLKPLPKAMVAVYVDGKRHDIIALKDAFLTINLKDYLSEGDEISALLLPQSREILYDPIPFGNITILTDVTQT